MELRHLRSFVVAAEELHVGRAASRLHLTQPSLSRQIAALERDVGVPLFTRVRRRFGLTPAGEVFLAAARDIVRRADDAARDAQRAHRGELGTLRLGFVQSATFEAMPRLLAAFRAAHPDVTLTVSAMTTLRQVEALRDGHIDVGLLRPPISEPTLTTRVVSRDPLVVALPGGHPLTRRERVPLAALAEEPFVLYTREFGPAVQDAIIGHCMAAGFTPRIVQEAAGVQTIVSLVAAGLGVSLLIAPTPPTAERAVAYRPISDDIPTWELVLAWPTDNRKAVLDRFLAVAEQA
ncbi:MAG TPA: LysR family transcriptional regulator [Actinophytocola sp.]|jgi:DNA-binding transcriptional LysR family regulator|uniref:LysR family transcriptional regulator n=1 Tax=Actinophytocola sp. TaxID=1872138 RepID=UPI002F93B486